MHTYTPSPPVPTPLVEIIINLRPRKCNHLAHGVSPDCPRKTYNIQFLSVVHMVNDYSVVHLNLALFSGERRDLSVHEVLDGEASLRALDEPSLQEHTGRHEP